MDTKTLSSRDSSKALDTTSVPVPFEEHEIGLTIPARFERIVLNHPAAVAIRSASSRWSYDALNRRANQIARSVQQHQSAMGQTDHVDEKGRKDCPIALVFDHDANVILAMLAVLKTGRTYVVVGPADPELRVQELLEELGVTLLLADTGNSQRVSALIKDSMHSLNIDELDSNALDHNLSLLATPDTVATIFFTSGSTGKPKGVARTHRQMLFRVWADTNDCKPMINDAVSHLYFNNSAASAADAYFALLNGATLCPFNVQLHSVEQWLTWLQQEKIRFLHPSIPFYRQLLQLASGVFDLPKLSYLSLAGQKLYRHDAEQFQACFPPGCKLVHRFSASEASVIARFFIDHETPLPPDDVIPIGYPVPGKRVFVADDQGRELAIGEIGEICVQSHYLSPGYWGDPEQTHSRFIEDPTGTGPRIYRTGDEGRVRPDGCLEHHGRKDLMVKIRGYRVELEAIDRALASLPGIQDALVRAHELPDNSHRLVAYVVYAENDDRKQSVAKSRQALAECLPEYMIPSQFVELDALPLTATGKTDRQALHLPDNRRAGLNVPYAEPSTPFEEILCEIWSEVLGVDAVGIDDPFLSLGGNSLQAMSIATRIQQRFAVHIPTPEIFTAGTVAEMALLVLSSLVTQDSSATRASDSAGD